MCAPLVTRHTSIRYSSSCYTRVNMGASIFFAAPMIRALFIALTNGLVCRGVLSLLCTNARCTVTTDLLCDIPTHKTTSPPERPFAHHILSHSLTAEMWTTMKNNLLGEKGLSCSFYLYRFRKYVPYGFPVINICNPGVHYETPVYKLRSHYGSHNVIWASI